MSREGGNRLAEFLSRTGARWSIRISQGSLNKLSVLFKQRARIPAPEWQLQPSDPKILMPAESARQSSSAVSTNLCSALQGLLASSCARLASARFSAGKSSTRTPGRTMPQCRKVCQAARPALPWNLYQTLLPLPEYPYIVRGFGSVHKSKLRLGMRTASAKPRQAVILPVLPPPPSRLRGERAL